MIFNEDIIKWAKEYDGEKYHALLSDPPYHLTSIVKRFGGKDSAPAKFGTDGVFSRSSKGFMGQTWDGGDIAFQPETWATIMPVLHDGAFGMAFSASRNWHRLAVAIEDAGFIIHPTIFGWLNGQGFPKATRVHKEGQGNFDGHRYGLQALKPAVEPIIVFQKPHNGRARDNIQETGAGVLNIDGTRIPTSDEYVINRFEDGMKPWGNGAGHEYTTIKIKEDKRLGGNGSWKTDKAAKNVYEGGYAGEEIESSSLGRYPSNFIVGEYGSQRLDNKYNYVSRYFYQVESQLDNADPIYYCSKVSPKERNAGLEDLNGKITDDGRKKSIDNPFLLGETVRKNNHPTVKPIDLCTYLAKLLLPPAEYAPRRLLVPFSGVASEIIGGYLAGWEEVDGVEFDKENGYIDIAKKRIEYWRNK